MKPRICRTGNMRILHILAVFTIETVVLCSCDGIKVKCTNIDEFYYASPDSHCTTYYRCTSRGQHEDEECPPGSMFDFSKQACTRSSGICYEPICTGRSNGIYQDTTHACRLAYTCYAGRVTSIDNCPPKQLHNGQKCVDQQLVSCGAPETTAIGYPFAGDQRCVGKIDGYYGVVGNCSEYLVCLGQEVSDVKHCPSGFHFEHEKQVCLPKHLIPYCSDEADVVAVDENVCRNKRNGANVDPTSADCTGYLMCKDGKLESQRRCSNQAIFNGESCVPSPLFECPMARRTSANVQLLLVDICHKRANGFYASPQHGCRSYARCMAGRAVEINECPAGQYFDAESRNCVFEKFIERRRCFDRGISLDCDGKANGFYREPNCQIYYHCYGGYKTEYKCSTGKVFNGERCVSKSHYVCPTAGGDASCANRPDGYFKDHSDGCRSYHFCSSGHKITYLCEEGHTFDGRSKKCVRQQLSGNSGGGLRCRSDFLCYGKSDGYHADYRSNCRNYVFCKNYEKITQLTCRDNNVFNGQKCVPPAEYACPSLYNHRQLNCMPKHCIHQCRNDGFYPDLNTDCRDYFFCIGGKASKLSCPLGKRFNGEICVAEDKFSCPVFCSNSNNSNDASSSCPLGGYVA